MLASMLFGVRTETVEAARVAVERTLHVTLEERESSHYGGVYFRFNGPDLQELVLQENVEIPEMEPAEEEFPEHRYLLYVSGFPEASPLLTALEAAPELFEKLRTKAK
jgi:hypothetical protein